MDVVHSSPSHELANLHSTMDRLFMETFGDAFRSFQVADAPSTGVATYRLPINVVQTNGGYRIEAPLPGVKPADVEITFSEGILSINAKRSEERSRVKGRLLRREMALGSFERQVTVPGDVQAEHIKASFKSGMLSIDVPRAGTARPAQVQIHSGERPKRSTRAGSVKGPRPRAGGALGRRGQQSR